MSQTVSFNGVTFTIPDPGESSWGSNLTNYFIAIPQGCLQKIGGTFTLTAEANFGATYGLLAAYFKTRTSLPSTAGLIRLAVGDTIAWRNNANAGNLAIAINGSDQLTFNGSVVALQGLGLIVNADISASAAITRSKLASGSINHVLINDGSGVMSSEAQLAILRGGTGQATKTAAFDALSPGTTKGDLVVFNGTNNVRFPAGTTGQALFYDSTTSTGLVVGNPLGTWGGSAGGTTDALTLTPSPALAAYLAGTTYTFLASATSTLTNPTVNISGLGAKTLVSNSGGGLVAGSITSGDQYTITYDGTHFRVHELTENSYIFPDAVRTVHILNSNVTTAKIADGNITQAKLQAVSTSGSASVGNLAVSGSCSTFTSSSAGTVAVTNLSVSIVTTGRPVLVGIQPDGSGGNCEMTLDTGSATFTIKNDTTGVAYNQTWSVVFGAPLYIIDTSVIGGGGTYTYTIYVNPNGHNLAITRYNLLAKEI